MHLLFLYADARFSLDTYYNFVVVVLSTHLDSSNSDALVSLINSFDDGIKRSLLLARIYIRNDAIHIRHFNTLFFFHTKKIDCWLSENCAIFDFAQLSESGFKQKKKHYLFPFRIENDPKYPMSIFGYFDK